MQTGAQKWPFLSLLSGAFFLLPLLASAGFVISYDFQGFDHLRLLFFLLNLVFVSLICFQVGRAINREKWLSLAQPPVLTSLFFFGKDFFLPNMALLLGFNNPIADRFLSPVGNELYWLTWATVCCLLAISALWFGFNLSLSRIMANRVRNFLQDMNLIRRELRVNLTIAVGLILLSIGSVLVQIRLGVYGYSSELENLYQYSSATAWLNLMKHGGSLSLLVLTMTYFTPGRERRTVLGALFFAALGWEIFGGFMSGFKSQVVWPVIMVGFGFYFVRSRLSWATVILFPILLLLAFHVIENFRIARWTSSQFDGTSLTSIANTLWDAGSSDRYSRLKRESSSFEDVLTRTDIITFTARSLAYADTNVGRANMPSFGYDLAMIPVNAFIPRFIWGSKSFINDGHWFNTEVLGADPRSTTAVGMGPISYLYFVGGMVAVWIGFFLLGVVQRVAFSSLLPLGAGGWIVYLGMLSLLAIPISNVSAGIGGLLRMLPFLIIAQLLLLKRSQM